MATRADLRYVCTNGQVPHVLVLDVNGTVLQDATERTDADPKGTANTKEAR